MSATAAALWSLPWIVPPIAGLLRFRRSRSLDDVSPEVPTRAPLVSVVVPARNERRNIERCVSSILATNYPSLEVIVVDDHSTDGTGDIARRIATRDTRLRVVDAPPLPSDWFGKQWACATGAAAGHGRPPAVHRRRHEARARSASAGRQRADQRSRRSPHRRGTSGDAQLLGARHSAAALRDAGHALWRNGTREPREARRRRDRERAVHSHASNCVRRSGRSRGGARSRRRGSRAGSGILSRSAAQSC